MGMTEDGIIISLQDALGLSACAAELKPDTLYGHCHLECPASTRPESTWGLSLRLNSDG